MHTRQEQHTVQTRPPERFEVVASSWHTNQEMPPRDTPVVRTSIRRTIIHQAFILKLVHL